MVRHRRWSRQSRPALLVTVVLTLAATATSTPYAAAAPGGWRSELGMAADKAGGAQVDVSTRPLKVVSSTGHRLKLLVRADRSDSGAQIGVGVETRDGSEEHDWTFQVPRRGVSVAADGTGRLRLSSARAAGDAIVSLRISPQGSATHTTCQGKVATRTRHVTLTGTVLLRTRSTGERAWGKVGGAHRRFHFSQRSTVRWTKRAEQNCSPPTIACRNTFSWMVNGGSVGDFELMLSANKGAHAQIGGLRAVDLAEPAGATRTDLVLHRAGTPNQLIVNGDGSATMQATFHAGTATLTAPQPATTATQRCRSKKGHQKVSVEFWSADFANGPVPIRVPAQIFGGFSVADTPSASFERIRVLS